MSASTGRPIPMVFYKASGIGRRSVPDVTLVFNKELPDLPSLQGAAELYETEGKALEVELRAVLAGGVYDALLRHMLLNRASLLRISLPSDVAGGA